MENFEQLTTEQLSEVRGGYTDSELNKEVRDDRHNGEIVE